MNKKKIYVLDACSLTTFLKNEKGADKIMRLLQNAVTNHVDIFFHAIHLYEIFCDCRQIKGKTIAESLVSDIVSLPLFIERRISSNVIQEIENLKITEPIDLADLILLGIARLKKAAVVTCDHQTFDIFEKKYPIKFYWFR